jgi:hypothetical protein
MPDNSDNKMVVLTITMSLETGEINFSLPQSCILTLGMLEAAREMVMMRTVRPMMAPQVTAAMPMPLKMPGRS